MAKETKQQRLEREQQEREEKQAATVAEYPKRLMAALERVNQNYTLALKVVGSFFVVWHTTGTNKQYELEYDFDPHSDEELYDLELELDSLDTIREEARRRQEVLENAQRKAREYFNSEERELLGL